MSGYGDPPKEHQIKKGEVRNPKGRPIGAKDYHNQLTELMNTEIDMLDPITKVECKKKLIDVINIKLMQKAIQGDLGAINQILDRFVGKAPEKLTLDTPKQGTIKIEIIETDVKSFNERNRNVDGKSSDEHQGDEGTEGESTGDDENSS